MLYINHSNKHAIEKRAGCLVLFVWLKSDLYLFLCKLIETVNKTEKVYHNEVDINYQEKRS